MREGLLDLLLFQNTGWKTEPTRPEKSPESTASVEDKPAEEEQNSSTDAEDSKTETEQKKDIIDSVSSLEQNDAGVDKPKTEAQETDEGAKESSVEKQTEGNQIVVNNQGTHVSRDEVVQSNVPHTDRGGNVESKAQVQTRPVNSNVNTGMPPSHPQGSHGMGYPPMQTHNQIGSDMNIPPQMQGQKPMLSKSVDHLPNQLNPLGSMNIPPEVLQQLGAQGNLAALAHIDPSQLLQGLNPRMPQPNQQRTIDKFAKPSNQQMRPPESEYHHQHQMQSDLMNPAAFSARPDPSQPHKQKERNPIQSPTHQRSFEQLTNQAMPTDTRYIESSQGGLVNPAAYGSMDALSQLQGRQQSPTQQTLYDQYQSFGQVSQAQMERILAPQVHMTQAQSVHGGMPGNSPHQAPLQADFQMPNVRPSISNTSLPGMPSQTFSSAQKVSDHVQATNLPAGFPHGMTNLQSQVPRIPYVNSAQFAMPLSQSPELSGGTPPLSQTPPLHAQSPDMIAMLPPNQPQMPAGIPAEMMREFQASPPLAQSLHLIGRDQSMPSPTQSPQMMGNLQQHTGPTAQPHVSNVQPSLVVDHQGLPLNQTQVPAQWSGGDVQMQPPGLVPTTVHNVAQEHHDVHSKMNPNASAFQPQMFVPTTSDIKPPTSDTSHAHPQSLSPLSTAVTPEKRQSIGSLHSSGTDSDIISPIKQGQVNQITDLCQPGSIFGSTTTSGVTSSRFPQVNSADVSLDENTPLSPASGKIDEEMPELEEHLSVSSSDHVESVLDKNSRPSTPQETANTLSIDVHSANRDSQVASPTVESEGSLSPNKERELEIKALIEMGLSNDEPKERSWSTQSSSRFDGAGRYDSKSYGATSGSVSLNNNNHASEQPVASSQNLNHGGYSAFQATSTQNDTLMSPQQFGSGGGGRGRISRAKGAINSKSPQKGTDKHKPFNSNNNGFTEASKDLMSPQEFQKGFTPIGNSQQNHKVREPKSQSMASYYTQNEAGNSTQSAATSDGDEFWG